MSRNTYLRNRFVLFAAVLVKSMAAANAFSQLFQANNRLAPATRKRWCAGALFLPHVAQRQGGAKLKERRTEKVGKLQHNSTPIAGNSYWMAFSNSGRRVKTDGNGAPGRHGSAPFFPVHAGKADAAAQVAVAAQASPSAPAGRSAVQNVASQMPSMPPATASPRAAGNRLCFFV